MMWWIGSVVCFLMLSAVAPGSAHALDVNAGPIWNNADAQSKCPGVCQRAGGKWNGNWKTTIPDQMSVCGCEARADAPRHSRAKRSLSGDDPTCGGPWQVQCTVCTDFRTSQAECADSCDKGYVKNDKNLCAPRDWHPQRLKGDMKNWDKAHRLPMDGEAMNYVTELKPGVRLPEDGLYIFVYRTKDNKLLIRRSDRPGDAGCFGKGDKRFSYSRNPKGNGEDPHMFVRHSQLNGGWDDVWSAGQLEIKDGHIIWISPDSGHFRPDMESLNYVRDTLDSWGIENESNVSLFPAGFSRDADVHCASYDPKKWTEVPKFRPGRGN